MVSGSGCEIRVRHLMFKGSKGSYGEGLWKYIQRGWDSFMHFTHFDVEEFLEFMDSRCTR